MIKQLIVISREHAFHAFIRQPEGIPGAKFLKQSEFKKQPGLVVNKVVAVHSKELAELASAYADDVIYYPVEDFFNQTTKKQNHINLCIWFGNQYPLKLITQDGKPDRYSNLNVTLEEFITGRKHNITAHKSYWDKLKNHESRKKQEECGTHF